MTKKCPPQNFTVFQKYLVKEWGFMWCKWHHMIRLRIPRRMVVLLSFYLENFSLSTQKWRVFADLLGEFTKVIRPYLEVRKYEKHEKCIKIVKVSNLFWYKYSKMYLWCMWFFFRILTGVKLDFFRFHFYYFTLKLPLYYSNWPKIWLKISSKNSTPEKSWFNTR